MNTQKQISITGQINTAHEYRAFTQTIQNEITPGLTMLEINILESGHIASSALGYLIKLSEKEKIDITLRCKKSELADLLRDLQMDEKFTIQEF